MAYNEKSWKKDMQEGLEFANELVEIGDPSGKLMLDILERPVDVSEHEMQPHPALALKVAEKLVGQGSSNSDFITFVDEKSPALYGADSATYRNGRIYFRGDAMPHVVSHELAHRTHVKLNPNAFGDIEVSDDPINIAARSDRKAIFKGQTAEYFEKNGEFDKSVMKALRPKDTPKSVNLLEDSLYLLLQAFREINASIVGIDGYCYRKDEGCRRNCRGCKEPSKITRSNLPLEHKKMDYGNNNQEAVAYMAQIQESGNQLAIRFAKHKYPDIYEQVESMRLKGEYVKK